MEAAEAIHQRVERHGQEQGDDDPAHDLLQLVEQVQGPQQGQRRQQNRENGA